MSIDSVSTVPSPPPETRTVERERPPERERQPAPEPREAAESSASSDPARGRTIDMLV